MTQIKLSLGGTAVVACIHQRVKREVTTDVPFNPRTEFLQLCPCCENVFVTTTDEPFFCKQCGDRPVPQGGLLQLPRGVNK